MYTIACVQVPVNYNSIFNFNKDGDKTHKQWLDM